MDTRYVSEILRRFVKAGTDFKTKSGDVALIMEYVDLLISLDESDLKAFGSKSVLMWDTIATLIALLNDHAIKTAAARRILCLVEKWVEFPSIHIMLKSFQLVPTLASFVCNNDDEDNATTFRCMDLLKTLSYQMSHNDNHPITVDFLRFLITKIIEKPLTSLAVSALVVLSNIARNMAVQQSIKNMEEAKLLNRTLIDLIGYSGDSMTPIAALSIFVSCDFYEEVGLMLFQSLSRLTQTLELVLNKLINHDSDTQCCAVQVFINLMEHEKFRQAALQYKNLTFCLEKIICQLDENSDKKSVCKIYEMFISLASVSAFVQHVQSALQSVEATSASCKPIFVAVHWFKQSPEFIWNVPVRAAEFLRMTVKNLDNFLRLAIKHHLEDVLSTVRATLSSCCEYACEDVDAYCEKITACLQFMLELCQDKDFTSSVVDVVDANLCRNSVEFLLGHFAANVSYKSVVSAASDERVVVVEAIVNILRIMAVIKSADNGLEQILYGYLQDLRMMSVLAHSMLLTDRKEMILEGLKLAFLGSRLLNFPIMCLAAEMFRLNTSRYSSLRYTSVIQNAKNEEQRFSSSYNVDELSEIIDRFKKGMSLDDVKFSQIMEMYEHKIFTLEMMEKHLLNLVDVKTNEGRHADYLLAQYRSRWANSDAEELNLRNVLIELEKRSEAAKQESTLLSQQKKQLDGSLLAAEQAVNELRQKNEDQDRKIAEKQDRIKSLQQNVNDFSRENKMLAELNIALRECTDSSQAKVAELEDKVSQVTDEMMKMSKAVKDLDSKCKESELTNQRLVDENAKLNESFKEMVDDKDRQIACARQELERLQNAISDIYSASASIAKRNTSNS